MHWLPWFALAFLVGDLLLVALYLRDGWHQPVAPWIDLNREANLPTYYAACQLFVVAGLTAVIAGRHRAALGARWLLWLLPLLFVALAADEVLRVHEDVGLMLDELRWADRRGIAFNRTGVWMFAIGIPFTLAMAWYATRVWPYVDPNAARLIALGFAVFLAGAIGIETFANFVDSRSRAETFQVVGEEGLELLGVTIVLWGALIELSRPRPLDRWDSSDNVA